jgi:hypothetical protein
MSRNSLSTFRDRHPGRRLAIVLVGFVLAPLLLISVGAATPAGAASAITLTGRINGQSLATSSQSNPVRLYPLRPATVTVTVRNNSSTTLHVATVRLAGEVVGLTFFAFDNSVAFAVPAHTTVTNRYSIPLVGLNGQATGLIEGSLSVLDPGQRLVASQGLVVDVRGSLGSVYGVFGLAVALLTLLALVLVLLELARHRLHSNRFVRGLYFLVPGLGVGLVLVFTLSATRVFVPSVGHWVPLVVVSAAILFVVGFLTPDPGIEDDDDEDLPLESVASTAAPVGSMAATRRASAATPAPETAFPDAVTPPAGTPKVVTPATASPAAAPKGRKPAPPTVGAPIPSTDTGPSAPSRHPPPVAPGTGGAP